MPGSTKRWSAETPASGSNHTCEEFPVSQSLGSAHSRSNETNFRDLHTTIDMIEGYKIVQQ